MSSPQQRRFDDRFALVPVRGRVNNARGPFRLHACRGAKAARDHVVRPPVSGGEMEHSGYHRRNRAVNSR